MTNVPPKFLQKKDKVVDRKLTDFFPQSLSSSLPLSSSPSMSSSKAPATTSTTSTTFRPPASCSSRPVTRASKAAVERDSTSTAPRSIAPSRKTRSASAVTSFKRARSPDNPFSASHIVNVPCPKPESPNKRMRKFESERPQAVIYVTSPFSPRNPLACHPLSSVTPSKFVSSQRLAVSQPLYNTNPVPSPSDSKSRDLGKVQEDVQRWRHKAFEFSNPPFSQARNDAMEVPSSPSHSSPAASVGGSSSYFDDTAHIRSVTTSVSNTTSPDTLILPPMFLPSSPDANESPPLPPTPRPLDKESKAAKLIADIKARTYIANHSSDDEKPLQFRELDDSDDDDLDLLPTEERKRKCSLSTAPQVGNDLFSSPLSSLPCPIDRPTSGFRKRGADSCCSHQFSSSRATRASERYRKSPLAFRLPTTIVRSSASVKKAQAPNPLDDLLRERNNADNRGTSSVALRLAEAAVKQSSREMSVDSDDNPYGTSFSRLDLADEQAAWKAVQQRSRTSSSPFGGLSDTEDLLGAHETKILGVAAGEAINKIFAGDKTIKGKERAQISKREKALGVPLWTSSDDDMEVDSRPTPVNLLVGEGHPIFGRLEQLHRSGDDSLLALVLSSGILGVMPSEILSSNVSQVLSFALFSSSQVADAAYIALCDMWELRTPKVQLTFFTIASILARLGARPSIFEKLGWPTDASAQKNHFTSGSRATAVTRLLAIVKASVHAGTLSSDDTADVVLSLVHIGLDISTLNDLQMQLNVTIDAVCNHYAEDLVVHSAIHEKLLSFARELNAVNKARLVSFFGSGGGRTRHVAQWLAYCILVPTTIPPTDQLPSLDPLILLLSPEAGSRELFDVTCETTDYEDLGHYVTILAVALANIAPYVREERTITQSASIAQVEGSPSKARKPVLPLELLRRVLEVVQGKIVDTRAAHLDRSRTKAAMQRLTMRIHYERLAIKGVGSRGRTSTLQAYFHHNRPAT
ncbi:hypothetical protein BS17DRAFT_465007 [Gyrodon lividus]|nr:hypothetical protein BS17DRAFT_465007 [Gyrodon lividus]